MKLTVIATTEIDNYCCGGQRATAHTVECPDDKPETVHAMLCMWLGQQADVEDVWVFREDARIAFDHEAEKRRMVAEAADRKRIADAEALAKNADEARAAKPPRVRDRELEAARAEVARLKSQVTHTQAVVAARDEKARNWEKSSSTLATKLAQARATLQKHGLAVEEPRSEAGQRHVAERAAEERKFSRVANCQHSAQDWSIGSDGIVACSECKDGGP